MASFLENMFTGCTFAFDHLIKGLKNINGSKKNIYHLFARTLSYLFTFEPRKHTLMTNVIAEFFKIRSLKDSNDNPGFDWKKCMT